jgi:ElaB/YqjD/DUF883 family membrane-anchored ribosome-binding protein
MNIEKTINNVDKKIKEGTDRVYDKVDAVRREGKEWAQDTSERAEDGLEQVRETLEKSWDKAKKTGSDIEEKLAAYGKQGLKAAQQYTQKNPFRVVAIALAVGVLAGGWLFTRSRE